MARDRAAWNASLPARIAETCTRWKLKSGTIPLHEAPTASWVGSVLWNNMPAVLKIPFPHFEGQDEALGLKFWNGEPAVKLLALDEASAAMLLEHCLPGNVLRQQAEEVQDEVIAYLLKQLWHRSADRTDLSAFRTLAAMFAAWREEASLTTDRSVDMGLQAEGYEVLQTLAKPSQSDVLLATDLHAGNVLRHGDAWRIIDPKPFVGERSYDLVQHMLNCRERLASDPVGLTRRLSDLAEVDGERLRLFLFGRLATMAGGWFRREERSTAIRKLAP